MCRGAAWAGAAPANPPCPRPCCKATWLIVCAMELADELYQTAEEGDEAAVRQLLAAGARADQADAYGWLPLHVASSCSHEGVVRLLLEAAPDTALAMDKEGVSPLHFAADCGDLEVMKLVLSAPAAAAMLSADEEAAIHHTAYFSKEGAGQLLLEAAPELAFARNAYGRTSVHCALGNSRHPSTAPPTAATQQLREAAVGGGTRAGFCARRVRRNATAPGAEWVLDHSGGQGDSPLPAASAANRATSS